MSTRIDLRKPFMIVLTALIISRVAWAVALGQLPPAGSCTMRR